MGVRLGACTVPLPGWQISPRAGEQRLLQIAPRMARITHREKILLNFNAMRYTPYQKCL
jgi:hypothetical protein